MFALLVLALLSSSCRFHDLGFRQDRRIVIVSPAPRATVTLPLTIRWTFRDFAIATGDKPGGSFAVLVDRDPPPPGQTLHYYFRDRIGCSEPEGCPSIGDLEAIGVWPTTKASLSLPSIRQLLGGSGQNLDHHEVTIILLDASGRRIGESAFSTEFTVAGDSG